MRAKAMIVIWTLVLVIGTSIQMGTLNAKSIANLISTDFLPGIAEFTQDTSFASDVELF